MPQLICENVCLGYDGNTIVKNLNFSVSEGDYLCVVGENGAGKSTLIRTILRLQPPLSGKITLGDSLRRDEIGYLPQQTAYQKDFPASVREIVLSGCLNKCGLRPFYNSREKESAQKMMIKLGVDKLAKRCYRELSGGQQQRVLLCRALCAADKLLVLDEPVSGLDPKASAEMYEIIHKLNVKEKKTIIMVTHDLEASLRYASHILHIAGETVYFGDKDGYLKSAAGRAFTGKSGGEMHE